MANDDLAPPELPNPQIPPTDQQTPTENSSVQNQSGIPVKETADLGEQTQVLDIPLMANHDLETPSTDTSDQENSSHENPPNRAEDSVFDKIYQNDKVVCERFKLLNQITDLNISLLNVVILYDKARSNCKKADVDKGKVLQDFGANVKILQDPIWFTSEMSSLTDEDEIWRENREALDANLKKLISMFKIASATDTPDRYDTSTLGEQTIAEELKPYATQLNQFESHMGKLTGNRRALDANIEKLIMMLKITVKLEPFPDTPDGYDVFTIDAETLAEEIKTYAAELEAITNSIRSKQFETQKKKSFWVWISAATTVVAAASMAYVAGQYRKSIRL